MAIIEVGPNSPYTDLQHAVATAQPHDEIRITGPLDLEQGVVIDRPLSFVGYGRRPVIALIGLLPAGGGVLTTRCDTKIRNLEFRGGRALTGNGAGLWHESGQLDLADCIFSTNQNGLFVAGDARSMARVTHCRFTGNGAGCGHTHGLYFASGARLEVDRCAFENTVMGHHVKSRAARTRVQHSYFSGSPAETTSYAIDIANGGIAWLGHNLLVKGRAAMSRKFIAYGAEKPLYSESRLQIVSNIFISHRRTPSVGVVNFAHGVPASLHGNAFEGVTFPLLGRGRSTAQQIASRAIALGAGRLPTGVHGSSAV